MGQEVGSPPCLGSGGSEVSRLALSPLRSHWAGDAPVSHTTLCFIPLVTAAAPHYEMTLPVAAVPLRRGIFMKG